MSLGLGAAILTVSLSVGGGDAADKPALPRPLLDAALKTAGCTLPARQAEIVGTDRLGALLEIVEVSCWRDATNAGSILFAVPEGRPQDAQLITVEDWRNGRVQRAYSVASPGFDAKTRTLSSTRNARAAGDCGTIQELKWTGWNFRLLNVWSKTTCDGEPFEWDSRERWQVFPSQGRASDPDGSKPAGGRAQSSR